MDRLPRLVEVAGYLAVQDAQRRNVLTQAGGASRRRVVLTSRRAHAVGLQHAVGLLIAGPTGQKQVCRVIVAFIAAEMMHLQTLAKLGFWKPAEVAQSRAGRKARDTSVSLRPVGNFGNGLAPSAALTRGS